MIILAFRIVIISWAWGVERFDRKVAGESLWGARYVLYLDLDGSYY